MIKEFVKAPEVFQGENEEQVEQAHKAAAEYVKEHPECTYTGIFKNDLTETGVVTASYFEVTRPDFSNPTATLQAAKAQVTKKPEASVRDKV